MLSSYAIELPCRLTRFFCSPLSDAVKVTFGEENVEPKSVISYLVLHDGITYEPIIPTLRTTKDPFGSENSQGMLY